MQSKSLLLRAADFPATNMNDFIATGRTAQTGLLVSTMFAAVAGVGCQSPPSYQVVALPRHVPAYTESSSLSANALIQEPNDGGVDRAIPSTNPPGESLFAPPSYEPDGESTDLLAEPPAVQPTDDLMFESDAPAGAAPTDDNETIGDSTYSPRFDDIPESSSLAPKAFYDTQPAPTSTPGEVVRRLPPLHLKASHDSGDRNPPAVGETTPSVRVTAVRSLPTPAPSRR